MIITYRSGFMIIDHPSGHRDIYAIPDLEESQARLNKRKSEIESALVTVQEHIDSVNNA